MSTITIGTATVSVEWQGRPELDGFGFAKPCWSWSVQDEANGLDHGDTDLFGWGDGDDMLRSLCGFLDHYGEQYRAAMGGEPSEGWPIPRELAEWCYLNADELALASLDPEDME